MMSGEHIEAVIDDSEGSSSSKSSDSFDTFRFHPDVRKVRNNPTNRLSNVPSLEDFRPLSPTHNRPMCETTQKGSVQDFGIAVASSFNSKQKLKDDRTNSAHFNLKSGRLPPRSAGGGHMRRSSMQELHSRRSQFTSLEPRARELFPVLEDTESDCLPHFSRDKTVVKAKSFAQGFGFNGKSLASSNYPLRHQHYFDSESVQGDSEPQVSHPEQTPRPALGHGRVDRVAASEASRPSFASSADPSRILLPGLYRIRGRRSTQTSLASIASSLILSRVNVTETNLLSTTGIQNLRALGPDIEDYTNSALELRVDQDAEAITLQQEQRERERRHLLTELLTSERSYVNHLRILNEVWVCPTSS